MEQSKGLKIVEHPGDQNWTLKLYYSETSEERELIEIGEWVSRQIEMREREMIYTFLCTKIC